MSVYLSGWYGPLPLASCPELVVLKGNPRVVSKLLPGRHVKHLEILSTGSDEGATEQLGLCTKELNQLLSFIIECRVSKLPALEQFRSLRYLRLLAIYDDVRGFLSYFFSILWSDALFYAFLGSPSRG